ncbi:hypothetical protein N0V88_006989 [Collariella sp. IMI 366227]|nr:hypothetical protein N0V88_006989 [Collariella sp. IMI 366227]
MADPYSITTGITGLLPLVRAWDDAWTSSVGRLDEKIANFAATKPLTARGLLQQLVLFLRAVNDPDRLKVRYGLTVEKPKALMRFDDLVTEMKYISSYLYDIDNRFSSKDFVAFEEGRLRHMAYLQTVHYNLSGTEQNLNELFWRLEEFNRNLHLLTPPQISHAADGRVLELVVDEAPKDPDRTKRLQEAASYEAKHSIDPSAKAKYEDIAKFSNFCSAVRSANPDMSRRKIFSVDDFSFDAPYSLSPNATLARFLDYPTKYQSRLVLVEWIRVRKGTSISEVLHETKLTLFMLHAEKTSKLLLPAAIGLIYDETNPRTIGIIFQLPSHIRSNLPTKPLIARPGLRNAVVVRSPKSIAAERMPTSLRDLILKKEPKGIDLGLRFKLAKQLIDAIHLIHTSQFTHR